MTPERWRRVEQIVGEALDRSAAERAAFLDAACGSDAELRRRAEALLAADAEAGEFLETPAWERWRRPTPDGAELPESLGARLGAYRLVRLLGGGGMGVVYLAERADAEYRQRVAIKVLRPGVDTLAVVRRFRTERQILAGLDHPHVARLYDGGTTPDGRPYFVLEYVEGEPIDRYCDRHQLGVRERLALFLDVCAAVHYAHRRLVIHRDLKPSNVLMTGEGVPKLLDFGIAKVLGPEWAAFTLHETAPGLRPLTPSYASPEQLRGEIVTTASDVYGLGRVLYELLTGRRPGPGAEARSAIVKPSVAVTEGDGAKARARAFGASPAQLRRQLAGDLDNVILMALREEPERRYASAAQLADDLRHHLAGRPVLARPDTVGYRLGKFVRRHRLGVAAGTLAALLTVGFAGVTAFQSVELARERDRAELERDKAEQVTALMVELFSAADPVEGERADVTVREALDRGLGGIRAELAGEPGIRAALLHAAGRVYGNLGLYERAVPLLEETLKTRRREGESIELVETAHALAYFHLRQGLYDRAEPLLDEALELGRRLLPPADVRLGHIMHDLGVLHRQRGELAEAEAWTRRGLRVREQALGPAHPTLARSYNNLAIVRGTRGDYAAAERHFLQALDILERHYGEDHPSFYPILTSLGILYERRGDYERAERYQRRCVRLLETTLDPGHPDLATARHNLGTLYFHRGELERAETLFRRALEVREEVLEPTSLFLHDSVQILGELSLELERIEEAEGFFRRALAGVDRLLADDPEDPNARGRRAASLVGLGDVHAARQEQERARELWEDGLAAVEPLLVETPSHDLLRVRALALLRLGRDEEAGAIVERLLAEGWRHPEIREAADRHGWARSSLR